MQSHFRGNNCNDILSLHNWSIPLSMMDWLGPSNRGSWTTLSTMAGTSRHLAPFACCFSSYSHKSASCMYHSILPVDRKGTSLRDEILIDSNILARLLTIPTLLDTSKRRFCGRCIAGVLFGAVSMSRRSHDEQKELYSPNQSYPPPNSPTSSRSDPRS